MVITAIWGYWSLSAVPVVFPYGLWANCTNVYPSWGVLNTKPVTNWRVKCVSGPLTRQQFVLNYHGGGGGAMKFHLPAPPFFPMVAMNTEDQNYILVHRLCRLIWIKLGLSTQFAFIIWQYTIYCVYPSNEIESSLIKRQILGYDYNYGHCLWYCWNESIFNLKTQQDYICVINECMLHGSSEGYSKLIALMPIEIFKWKSSVSYSLPFTNSPVTGS